MDNSAPTSAGGIVCTARVCCAAAPRIWPYTMHGAARARARRGGPAAGPPTFAAPVLLSSAVGPGILNAAEQLES